ncbi:MAG: prephenate dehydrogenase/arogenate dehydrogenase family protein [Planctomycetia bacterium]|nr:prephenate dehydrogenase/arogenate dehydrogenase family protein [Planctomycetia bacterium]
MKENGFPRTVTILGVGLIGASIGRGLLNRGCVKKVVGWGRNSEKLQLAKNLGAISEFSVELKSAVRDADLVVVCVPVRKVAEMVRGAAKFAGHGTLFTDVGSTKKRIVQEIGREDLENACRFVAGHPIAGKEDHSLEASDGELFVGRTTVLTPTEKSDAKDIRCLRHFWESLGSKVLEMTPESHDAALAQTSHLPHVLACVLSKIVPEELYPLAGTGFASTSRVASGGVEVWRDILLENAEALQECLGRAEKEIGQLREMLRNQDEVSLESFLMEAKKKRESLRG